MTINRRTILAAIPLTGLSAMPVPAKEPEVDPHQRVKQDAKRLAASMKAIHGGDWRVAIDHECDFVVVIKDMGTEES